MCCIINITLNSQGLSQEAYRLFLEIVSENSLFDPVPIAVS